MVRKVSDVPDKYFSIIERGPLSLVRAIEELLK
jgi:hypothetical protein